MRKPYILTAALLGLGALSSIPKFSSQSRDSGRDMASGAKPDKEFTDSKGRRYTRAANGVIRRIKP